MNILFFTLNKLDGEIGGTERATLNTAKSLSTIYHHNCYSLYKHEIAGTKTLHVPFIKEDFLLREKDPETHIREILLSRKIQVIINQGSFCDATLFKRCIGEQDIKLIIANHFEPFWNFRLITFRNNWRDFKEKPSLGRFVRLVCYPLQKVRFVLITYRDFKMGCRLADKVVLLSPSYIPLFSKLFCVKDQKKLCAIPNQVSCAETLAESDLEKKKKQVLIVCRLEENQKRLSSALKVWNAVREFAEKYDWRMVFVGEGPDRKKYEHFVQKNKLYGVSFMGRQIPWDYYKESAIFLMTSKSEGFGMTLIEAQQMGCVPIVFDSFSAVHDIIQDECDGFIVRYRDSTTFASRLIELMRNDNLRNRMAKNGLKNCLKFSSENVGRAWNQVITGVI